MVLDGADRNFKTSRNRLRRMPQQHQPDDIPLSRRQAFEFADFQDLAEREVRFSLVGRRGPAVAGRSGFPVLEQESRDHREKEHESIVPALRKGPGAAGETQ